MTTVESAVPAKPDVSARWALAALALATLLASLGTSIANVALPTLEEAFGAGFQQVQWVVLAYLLVITVMSVGVGRLGDLIGHRRVLLAGIAIFTLASVVCGMADSLWVLIAARSVQGLGAAVLMALSVALVSGTVAKDRTGRVMGLLGTMSAIGTTLGPSLGGFLLAGPGWPAVFLVMVPLGLLNFFLAWRFLRTDDAPHGTAQRPGFDGLGSVLLAGTIAAYALAMTLGRGEFGVFNLVLLGLAVCGAGIFVFVETNVAAPLVRLSLLRDPVFSAGLGMNAIVATVMMATLVVGPFYLARALGLNQIWVGAIMSIGPVISAFSGVPAGRIVDRFGANAMIVTGLAGMALGSFALALLPAMLGLGGYVVAIALLTPSYQLFQAANNTAVMADVSREQRGVISGMLGLSRNLGLVTGASVMGAIFAAAAGMNREVGDIAFGLSATFLVAGALVVAALMMAVRR
jgi:MFS family permease